MNRFVETILTAGKVLLKSRKPGRASRDGDGKTLIVIGNGPSLRQTMAESGVAMRSHDTMAVNFAANTPEFLNLKPRHYIVADPHFFTSGDPNVVRLWENIARVDWPMTLHIPVKTDVPESVGRNPSVELRRFNMTPAEGYDAFCHLLFRHGLAMPRPRNVLIPAIMEGIREGYREIFIVGADHTWPHTLYVDDRNRVVTVQPHFYEDNKKELDRVAEAYKGIHIHDVLGSMVVAFRSYHHIRRFADREGVSVYNATPGSLIDAFSRKSLP